MVPSEDLRLFWVQALSYLGIPSDPEHLVGPIAWSFAEGGWLQNAARFNPLNTTMRFPGSLAINVAGVQSYPAEGLGIRATVATLELPAYRSVVAELVNGDPFALAAAVGASPWGTSAQAIVACIPRARAALGLDPLSASPTPTPLPEELDMIAISQDGKTLAGVRTDGHLIVATVGPSGTYNDGGLVDLSDRGGAVNPAGGPWTFAQS